MPPVAAAAAWAVAYAATISATTWFVIGSTALTLLMTLSAKGPKTIAQASQGTLVNTRNPEEVVPLMYGKGRIGGNQIFATTTGTDNKYLHVILTLGEGEINGIVQVDSIDQIFLDGVLYTESDYKDIFTYEFFSGSSTQNVCSTLNTAYDNWTDPLRRTSYLYYKLEYDRDNFLSQPTVTVILEGLKVKNFATEDDYASMPMAYSNNLAYCVYDLLTRPSVRGGKGLDPTRIDLTSFRDAATYYDTYGWTCNMPIKTDQSVEDNLAMLLINGRSDIVYSDSKFKLKFRDTREESVAMQLTKDDIIQTGADSTMVISPVASLFSRPNAIKATYYCEDKNYHSNEKVFQDDDAYATEGDYRELSINLLGLSSLSKVIPMSYYYLERARWGNIVNIIVGNKGISLEPFDLVEITSVMPGWTDAEKPMYRVESAQLQKDGNVALSLIQEHDDLYNDDYDVDTSELFITALPKPGDDPHSVINVSHAEEVYYYRDRSFTRWKIDFDPPTVSNDPFWDYAEIWLKIGADTYRYMTKSTTDYMLDPVEEGETYYVKMRSVSIYGVKESLDSCRCVSKLIVGKTDIPSDMTAITAVASGDTINIYGDKVSDPDIAGYEIRLGPAWAGGVFIAFNETPNFRLSGVKPGTFTFWCSPKDNSGNYSENPVQASCTVFYPPGYTDKNTWSWDYNGIGTHDNTNYISYSGDDCLQCSHGDLTGDLLDEDCSDISDWADGDTGGGTSYVNPAGQFRFYVSAPGDPSYAYRYRTLAGGIPNTITYEIKIYNQHLGTIANKDYALIRVCNGTTCFASAWASDGFHIYNSSFTEIGTNLVKTGASVEWQTWRFLINYSTLTLDIYLDDSTHTWEKVATGQAFTSEASLSNGALHLVQYAKTTGGRNTHVDHIQIQDGLFAPTGSLVGTWTSPEYDLGSTKTVRVFGDFVTVFVSSASSWEGIFPAATATTWADKTTATTTWKELTSTDIAATLEAKIKWGTSTGVYPNEADYFEILAPEFSARYLQVEVKITDSQADSYLYVKKLNMKGIYWS